MPVIESMHTGRPVISTNVGVVPELVRNGKNGWIIERNRSSLQNATSFHEVQNQTSNDGNFSEEISLE